MQQINTCEIIVDTLMEIREQQSMSHQVLRAVLDKYGYLEKRDRAYITRVVNGTLERELTLDYVLNRYSKTPVKKMKPVIRTIMRSAVYQILYLDGVPCSAVVNSAVNLSAKRGFKGLKPFVNGVLRTIVREKDGIPWPKVDKKAPASALSIRYSMPEWIVDTWVKRFGAEITESMLASFLKTHPTTIRTNVSRITPEQLKQRLEEEGVQVTAGRYTDVAFSITGYDRLTSLASFREGLFQVQDMGSVLIGLVSGASEGMEILDVCAAPGGKALHMADQGAHVTACDLTAYKTGLILENAHRNQCKTITVEEQDAVKFRPEWEEKYDLVLADLPCSGLGVLGRKPDLKYRIDRSQQEELQNLQKAILDNVKRYVKPGGYLLYSTCTINPGENEEMMSRFIREGEFRPVDLTGRLPKALLEDVERASYEQDPASGMLQLLPGVYETDGMFLCLTQKAR